MAITDKVKKKLQELPDKPGVYVMRDRDGRVIYVGKAASLKNRVRNYFQRGTLRSADPKLRGLINSIADFDVLVLRTEAEATLTEGRFIKDYRPRYNVAFRDDKRFLLLRIDTRETFPKFKTARIKKSDGATYFGPYASSASARAAMDFVEKRFGLRRCKPMTPGPADYKHCMNDIIAFCSAPCIAKVDEATYQAHVEEACAFLRGERFDVLQDLQASMEAEAEAKQFEKAAALRDTLLLLRKAIKDRSRGTKTFVMKAEDAREGVRELQKELDLDHALDVIEGYDISNISGTHAVGSMVCSVGGMPQRTRYRHFRIKTVDGIDDPSMMAEVIRRRYTRLLDEKGRLPDLVLVDGGITQLRAARRELDELGLHDLKAVGLAKRFEEIYPDPVHPVPLRLDKQSKALMVLQRLRDEAHRFALTYHRQLRTKRIRESVLDEIPGIGDKRKEQLLSHFGSVARLQKASIEEISAVAGIGRQTAIQIHEAVSLTREV